jgi:major membrane immunogen (membrane-anchored lipoprotein)
MNSRLLPAALIVSLLLTGCSLFPKSKQADDNQTLASKPKKDVSNGDNGMQKVEFVTGVSSVTVEKLAAKNQCTSKLGAGQISPKGPVEMYRIQCDDGRVLMARCELRQCQLGKH